MLDAPALQDDFYLNLVDWSSQNVLAVGLGTCVYLWSACTSKVSEMYVRKVPSQFAPAFPVARLQSITLNHPQHTGSWAHVCGVLMPAPSAG